MSIFGKIFSKKPLSPEEVKEKNNKFIKKMGVSCNDVLPCIEAACDTKLKDLDSICKRAVASLISIQFAIEIRNGKEYEEAKAFYLDLLNRFGVENELLDIEKRLFENEYEQRDIVNVIWTYECYWSLVWALGLVETSDFKVPNEICDCGKALSLVAKSGGFDNFKNKTALRKKEEIVEMLDLYYRYHWACVEDSINRKANIAALRPEVVVERRRGLEWLVSEIADWNEISLNT